MGRQTTSPQSSLTSATRTVFPSAYSRHCGISHGMIHLECISRPVTTSAERVRSMCQKSRSDMNLQPACTGFKSVNKSPTRMSTKRSTGRCMTQTTLKFWNKICEIWSGCPIRKRLYAWLLPRFRWILTKPTRQTPKTAPGLCEVFFLNTTPMAHCRMLYNCQKPEQVDRGNDGPSKLLADSSPFTIMALHTWT